MASTTTEPKRFRKVRDRQTSTASCHVCLQTLKELLPVLGRTRITHLYLANNEISNIGAAILLEVIKNRDSTPQVVSFFSRYYFLPSPLSTPELSLFPIPPPLPPLLSVFKLTSPLLCDLLSLSDPAAHLTDRSLAQPYPRFRQRYQPSFAPPQSSDELLSLPLRISQP
eukprot:754085-Hanusia_phi.AAC.4